MKYFWEKTVFLVPLLSFCHWDSKSRFHPQTHIHPYIFIPLLKLFKAFLTFEKLLRSKLKLKKKPHYSEKLQGRTWGKKTQSVQLISLPSANTKGGLVYSLPGPDGGKATPTTSIRVAYDPAGAEGEVMHSPDSDYRVLCQPFRKEWEQVHITSFGLSPASHFPNYSRALCPDR